MRTGPDVHRAGADGLVKAHSVETLTINALSFRSVRVIALGDGMLRNVGPLAISAWVAMALPAFAEADGPDFWQVSGVAADDRLMVHREASARSPIIGKLAHDATGLRNLGCSGVPTFSEWQAMTAGQRERSARGRWCRIEGQGLKGWVAGRFLREDASAPPGRATGPVTIGRWTVRCEAARCFIEQRGIAAQRATVLRFEPAAGNNARISVLRGRVPRQGTLAIHADGEMLASGPVAPLVARDGSGLVMEADDVTLGIVKRLAKHTNLVVSFPGEDRGVEFHAERFSDAMKHVVAAQAAASR